MQTTRLKDPDRSCPESGFLIPLGSDTNASFEIRDYATLGRELSSSILLGDPYVSSKHARIERTKSGFRLLDVGSRNGTFLNEVRVYSADLKNNDRLRMGESIFLFSIYTPDLAAPKSKNKIWERQLLQLEIFSQSDFPVLITGPSGAGKDVLARRIHERSPRASGPFLSINCSALSENLIESELFGHTKGAYTGAQTERKGAFESARNGTLFLDEIGDLPLSLQPKLLRALENGEIRQLGADKSTQINVRIIAATHRDIVQQIQTGEFREDLYYRLNVCRIQPPALVERMEDFEDLLQRFSDQLGTQFSEGAIAGLKKHRWPGNIRELRNVVARAAAYFPGQLIEEQSLVFLMDPTQKNTQFGPAAEQGIRRKTGGYMREIEREMIVSRLIANAGNQRQTALELGLAKSTLHDRIRHYQIDIKSLLKEKGG